LEEHLSPEASGEGPAQNSAVSLPAWGVAVIEEDARRGLPAGPGTTISFFEGSLRAEN